MPRRRPSRLRSQPQRLPASAPPVAKIPFLSARAAQQLALAEHAVGLPQGWVAGLLKDWGTVTRRSGYPLYLPTPICPCHGCDLVGARRALANALAELPRRERALIGDQLARIDRWYASRTLPDSLSISPHWFERRVIDQVGWG
jgi:hypothetical protein